MPFIVNVFLFCNVKQVYWSNCGGSASCYSCEYSREIEQSCVSCVPHWGLDRLILVIFLDEGLH